MPPFSRSIFFLLIVTICPTQGFHPDKRGFSYRDCLGKTLIPADYFKYCRKYKFQLPCGWFQNMVRNQIDQKSRINLQIKATKPHFKVFLFVWNNNLVRKTTSKNPINHHNGSHQLKILNRQNRAILWPQKVKPAVLLNTSPQRLSDVSKTRLRQTNVLVYLFWWSAP